MNELEQLRALRDACVERLAVIEHEAAFRDPEGVEVAMLNAERYFIRRLLEKAGMLPEQK